MADFDPDPRKSPLFDLRTAREGDMFRLRNIVNCMHQTLSGIYIVVQNRRTTEWVKLQKPTIFPVEIVSHGPGQEGRATKIGSAQVIDTSVGTMYVYDGNVVIGCSRFKRKELQQMFEAVGQYALGYDVEP